MAPTLNTPPLLCVALRHPDGDFLLTTPPYKTDPSPHPPHQPSFAHSVEAKREPAREREREREREGASEREDEWEGARPPL
eukprot:1724724-Rhodomonas_salina.1